MKKVYLSVLSLCLVILMGCSTAVNMTESGRASKAMQVAFIEPEASEWVLYHNIITEYFHYRTKAVIENDINILYEQYPALSEDISLEEGINIEGSVLENYNAGLTLIDANFNLEQYDRLKVNRISEDEAVLLVHGFLLYITEDFTESGGEFLMEVYLKKHDERWTVVKTDEYTLEEYKVWLDERNE